MIAVLVFSTRFCLTVLALGLMTHSTRASVVGQSSTARWVYPCAGGVAVEGVGGDIAGLVLRSQTSGIIDIQQTRRDWSDTLRALSDRAIRLKRHVRDLKNLYVQMRFRDDSVIQDLEQTGLRVEGMPSVRQPSVGSINNDNVVATLHNAFEYLARVAVFLEQARIGESLATSENISFESQFRLLEDHHESGLYWLLCALHRVIHLTGRQISNQVMGDVMSMRVMEVDRNSFRHTRDFLVLRDFERLLESLSIDFAALRNAPPFF